ncbi:unnamed protein product [Chrysodeixis includens]|uniref:Uncharacterized protein n=1 Tax=Chrysodeixis includens TaxID=689277 RepID=A0A9P0FQM6_CHRIL|nr:unnamed protein product [Chrysodeixis includens]
MSKRKRLKFTFRAMDKNSSTDSNISLDSLETFKRKPSIKTRVSEEKVDTILVPFYEKDVLIKVPKDQKRKQNNTGNKYFRLKEKLNKEISQANSYLVNKDRDKNKRTSYLEMFRKQFTPNQADKRKDNNEIRSLSPEFGDTERESIGDDANNPVPHDIFFYNTEPYNEKYYEKLVNRDIQSYLENSFDDQEDDLQFVEEINSKPDDICDDNTDNLRSVSEVSHRRRLRRATVEPIQNVKLGGLGPDIEKIKPRLERARSLQRYSEKVRMENRLRIYKKTCQTEIEKKVEKDVSVKRTATAKEGPSKERQVEVSASYLVNKSINDKSSKTLKTSYLKSKSADVQRIRERNAEKERQKHQPAPPAATQKTDAGVQKSESKKIELKPDVHKMRCEARTKLRTKSSSKNKAINTEAGANVPPVQISFMVNLGGARPSSALKSLEEKHRMYQEQVKAFMDNNNG